MIRTFEAKPNKEYPSIAAGDTVTVKMTTDADRAYSVTVTGVKRFHVEPTVHTSGLSFEVPEEAVEHRQTVVISVRDQYGNRYFSKRFAVVELVEEEVNEQN